MGFFTFFFESGAVRKPHLPGLGLKIRRKNRELNSPGFFLIGCFAVYIPQAKAWGFDGRVSNIRTEKFQERYRRKRYSEKTE